MSMNRILALSVTLACLTGAAAHAQDDAQEDAQEDAQDEAQEVAQDDDFARAGWYVGVYGVYALEAYRDTGGFDFDNTGAGNIRIGYRGNSGSRWRANSSGSRSSRPDSAGRGPRPARSSAASTPRSIP